ncbi:hypothetical protein E2562_019031 [Oryza meyeriana var. granulata]|uniref:DUF569 domain-containing protein n=1 Tax=Oryza meyeriana var. granulata TaxID=110450 RepID=A0A6G1EMW1_9ORYZ|nr:hypothetical protein E2562_019031 [Oryza meyeriana var. granulata]
MTQLRLCEVTSGCAGDWAGDAERAPARALQPATGPPFIQSVWRLLNKHLPHFPHHLHHRVKPRTRNQETASSSSTFSPKTLSSRLPATFQETKKTTMEAFLGARFVRLVFAARIGHYLEADAYGREVRMAGGHDARKTWEVRLVADIDGEPAFLLCSVFGRYLLATDTHVAHFGRRDAVLVEQGALEPQPVPHEQGAIEHQPPPLRMIWKPLKNEGYLFIKNGSGRFLRASKWRTAVTVAADKGRRKKSMVWAVVPFQLELEIVPIVHSQERPVGGGGGARVNRAAVQAPACSGSSAVGGRGGGQRASGGGGVRLCGGRQQARGSQALGRQAARRGEGGARAGLAGSASRSLARSALGSAAQQGPGG